MPITKFFVNPFAEAGDKIAVPDTVQGSGTVSYAQGYGPFYTLDVSQPNALKFPRQQHNQLLFDITTAINQYQTIGVPNFISTTDNLGSAFPYAKYSYALSGGLIYQSLVNSNTNLPTVTSAWRLVDNFGDFTVLNAVTFNAGVTNGAAVYWDSANNRYDLAIANGTNRQNVIGIADVTNGRVITFGKCSLLSSLTPGAIYYLSSATAGELTTTITNIDDVCVGIAVTSTQFLIMPFIQQQASNELRLCAVSNSVSQTIPVSSTAKLNMDTVVDDDYSMWDSANKRIVLNKIGLWEITATCSFTNTSTAGAAEEILIAYLNGVAYKNINGEFWAGENADMGGSILIRNSAITDYVELYFNHVSTAGPAILNANGGSFYVKYLKP